MQNIDIDIELLVNNTPGRRISNPLANTFVIAM